jgi:hypothetical protein
MADEELGQEAVRIGRFLEAGWVVLIKEAKEPITMLIYVLAISRTKAQPTPRENTDTAQKLHWVVREGVFSLSADIRNRLHFSDDLEVLVNWEIKANSGNKFIGPIE